ncbi:MAG TPA: bifunctional demethylmenaquinone methyltransferase/2-methoxy-6-polyprenyl-1,4-benzoquinol methylase UbiE [Gammaproteobacteria bacterium]|nr:bifunctional demethylmenaquinone methyltransferase/2-methoxy-6-polyprenyl-1,4-benzoquinol methylase UbiE [Gammaproteobacteria bacterium]
MDHDRDTETTDFGYREVPRGAKARLVRGVFDSVAGRYDLMNDLMSGGLHRLWKRYALELSGVRRGQRVLDLAGGTGDLAALLSRRVGQEGLVLLADINEAMLRRGRERLVDHGLVGNVEYLLADAERLPLASDQLDCISIGFGLRNVTDKDAALAEMHRVLRPGGRCLVLEFSRPVVPGLKPLYDWYSFRILPLMGRVVARDPDSYRYLAESIRRHPDQETLRAMMETAGFERCQYYNLAGGIVAVHRGFKL